jgi:hypothetical protein
MGQPVEGRLFAAGGQFVEAAKFGGEVEAGRGRR